MSEALDSVARHVNRQLSQRARPLFLDLDNAFRLRDLRGDSRHFGWSRSDIGSDASIRLPLLATLDPAGNLTGDPAQSWRFVSLPDAPVCHVHLLRLDDGWGLALLDASTEHAEQQARQQAAHELLLLREERERLLAELERSNRLKSAFIARMSHEFRTPLTSVIGYGEQLREVCDDARGQHYAGAVLRGGRYLLNLVENLLDQALIENQQPRIDANACDLHAVSDEAEQLLRPLAEQKNLALAWWFDGSIPVRVWLDAARLQQVLLNLVGNAIKFTDSGSINVEFDWRDESLHVAVSDSGPGIAVDQQQAIFEPYQQADDSHRTKGAGLGLAISRALVEAMDGELRLASSDSRGSRFEFHIAAPAVRPGGADADVLAGRLVLLVDDDRDLLDLFSLYLKAAGCSVHTAADAEQATTIVKRFRPDVAIVDLILGDANGTDVAAGLRRSGHRGPIVLLSAAIAVPSQGDGRSAFDACWQKPIGRAQLLDGIAGLLA